MAGFEVVVRPVILPNIRPAPSRSLPPEDGPEQGQAVLSGSSGTLLTLTYSYSASSSTSGGTEISRTFDVARISPEDDPHGQTYIDVEVAKKFEMQSADGGTFTVNFTEIKPAENVKIMQVNVTRPSGTI